MVKTLESQAYEIMYKRITNFSDSELQSIWDAILTTDCHPELQYSVYVNDDFIHIPFDDWAQGIHSEIEKRHLNIL